MSQPLTPHHQTVWGLRVAKPQDMARIPEVEKVLRGFGPNATAMYMATALNMIEELQVVAYNQRKRLSELQRMADAKVPAKAVGKYFAPQTTEDFLAELRSRHSTPATQQPLKGEGK